MSSKKDETAVHCCDSDLSVLVMLVSRNVFRVVSILQSVDCLRTPIWLPLVTSYEITLLVLTKNEIMCIVCE